LSGLRDGHPLPAADLEQCLVEPLAGVDGVADLVGGSPALAGPLLEQPEAVPVAVGEVAQPAFLQRGGQRDDLPAAGHIEADAGGDDGLRVRDLLRGQI
jgi:hypothetical protein